MAAVVGGQLDETHTMVGVFDGHGICTAALIDSHTAITAAICVRESERDLSLALDGGPPISGLGALIHPDFSIDIGYMPHHDLALIDLSQASTVAPARLEYTPPAAGMEVTVVGIGATAADTLDYGVRHVASSVIDAVEAHRFRLPPTSAGGTIAGAGDSGAPVFTVVDGHEVVIGLISAHETIGNGTWATSVHGHAAWLADNLPRPPLWPEITISSPRAGTTLSSPVRVEFAVRAMSELRRVECRVEGRTRQVLLEAPYRCDLHLDPGVRRVQILVYDKRGGKSESTVEIFVEDPCDCGVDAGPGDAASEVARGAADTVDTWRDDAGAGDVSVMTDDTRDPADSGACRISAAAAPWSDNLAVAVLWALMAIGLRRQRSTSLPWRSKRGPARPRGS